MSKPRIGITKPISGDWFVYLVSEAADRLFCPNATGEHPLTLTACCSAAAMM